jgi:hypothetical protein
MDSLLSQLNPVFYLEELCMNHDQHYDVSFQPPPPNAASYWWRNGIFPLMKLNRMLAERVLSNFRHGSHSPIMFPSIFFPPFLSIYFLRFSSSSPLILHPGSYKRGRLPVGVGRGHFRLCSLQNPLVQARHRLIRGQMREPVRLLVFILLLHEDVHWICLAPLAGSCVHVQDSEFSGAIKGGEFLE